MIENNNDAIRLKILDLVIVFISWKKEILLTLGVSIIIGIVLAFIVPRQYKSVARVLPPKEGNILNGLSSLSSLTRALPGGLARIGKIDDSYDYMALLKSRTVMEEVIQKFNLVSVYDISDSSREKAMKCLLKNIEIDWTEENTLELRVWDYDNQRAADIANFFIEMLNKRNYELQTQEARNTRIFIEDRLKQNQDDLRKAEQALQSYQEQEKMMVPIDPSASGFSSISELYTTKVKKEIELKILQSTVGEENTQFKQTKLELGAIEMKIEKLPKLGIGMIRLYRELVIQQKIMELVIPLYEQAKVNEHKDVPIAYLLDPAVRSEHPDRPKRVFILGITVFLGLILSLIIIVYKEYMAYLNKNHPEQFERIKNSVRMIWGKKTVN